MAARVSKLPYLLCFLCGVAVAALVAVPSTRMHERVKWEFQAYEHGAGYFEWNVFDQRLVWHWWGE